VPIHKASKLSTPASNADQQSAKIEAKLAQLNRQLNQPQTDPYGSQAPDPEIKRLHKMMRSMKSSGDEDPEMKQSANMLTKIQSIQNPEIGKAQSTKKKEASLYLGQYPLLWTVNKK
jgi:hypothetical protein